MEQLTPCAASWELIAIYLGFMKGEVENIKAHPLKLRNAPMSYLEEVLSQWLEWAPGDSRGSDSFATLETLQKALTDAEFPNISHELQVAIGML